MPAIDTADRHSPFPLSGAARCLEIPEPAKNNIDSGNAPSTFVNGFSHRQNVPVRAVINNEYFQRFLSPSDANSKISIDAEFPAILAVFGAFSEARSSYGFHANFMQIRASGTFGHIGP